MGALCKKVPDFFARGLEVHYTRTVWRLLSKLHQSSKSAPRTLQLDPGAFASAHDHIVCDLSRFGRRGDGLPNLQIQGCSVGWLHAANWSSRRRASRAVLLVLQEHSLVRSLDRTAAAATSTRNPTTHSASYTSMFSLPQARTHANALSTNAVQNLVAQQHVLSPCGLSQTLDDV